MAVNATFTVLPTYLSNCTLAVFHELPTLPFLLQMVAPSAVTFNSPIELPYMWYPNSKYASEPLISTEASKVALSPDLRGHDVSMKR